MQVKDPSLLRFMVDLRGADPTDKQLRDDLMTMLIAGHETTAAVLTWGLATAISRALLGRHYALDGVVVHYFLHAEPSGVAAWELARMDLPKMNHRRRVAGKRMSFELKRSLERTREIGVSRLA